MSWNAIEWYAQRVTGGLLLVLLAAHFWVEHFMSAPLRHGDLTFAVIRSRIANPAWQAVDIAFLIVALYHGLSGLRGILLDLGRFSRRTMRVLTLALMTAGVAWAWLGISAFRRL